MARFAPLKLVAGIFLALLVSFSDTAPLDLEEKSLTKRDSALYTLWDSIPAAQLAVGVSARYFAINQNIDDAWGVTFLHGCTALMISDPAFVIVAHLQQYLGASTTACINDAATLNTYLQNTLQPALDQHDATDLTRVDLMYNVCDTSGFGGGVVTIRSYLMAPDNFNATGDIIFNQGYVGSSGLGVNPNSPSGLAVVEWQKPQLTGLSLGTLKVFFGSTGGENPLRDDLFVQLP